MFPWGGVGLRFTGLLLEMIRNFNVGKIVCFRKHACLHCSRNFEFEIWLADSVSFVLIIVAVCCIDKLIYFYAFQALRFPSRGHGIFIFSSVFCTTEFLRWASISSGSQLCTFENSASVLVQVVLQLFAIHICNCNCNSHLCFDLLCK